MLQGENSVFDLLNRVVFVNDSFKNRSAILFDDLIPKPRGQRDRSLRIFVREFVETHLKLVELILESVQFILEIRLIHRHSELVDRRGLTRLQFNQSQLIEGFQDFNVVLANLHGFGHEVEIVVSCFQLEKELSLVLLKSFKDDFCPFGRRVFSGIEKAEPRELLGERNLRANRSHAGLGGGSKISKCHPWIGKRSHLRHLFYRGEVFGEVCFESGIIVHRGAKIVVEGGLRSRWKNTQQKRESKEELDRPHHESSRGMCLIFSSCQRL